MYILVDIKHRKVLKDPVTSLDESIYSQEDNYKEALSSYQNLGKTKMKLVPVSSLEDIINYLKGE